MNTIIMAEVFAVSEFFNGDMSFEVSMELYNHLTNKDKDLPVEDCSYSFTGLGLKRKPL